jgi:hypothetical protein
MFGKIFACDAMQCHIVIIKSQLLEQPCITFSIPIRTQIGVLVIKVGT